MVLKNYYDSVSCLLILMHAGRTINLYHIIPQHTKPIENTII